MEDNISEVDIVNRFVQIPLTVNLLEPLFHPTAFLVLSDCISSVIENIYLLLGVHCIRVMVVLTVRIRG